MKTTQEYHLAGSGDRLSGTFQNVGVYADHGTFENFVFHRHHAISAKRESPLPTPVSDANIVLARSAGMDYDHDKVDEMVMALLYLTTWEEAAWGARAWKSHDWDVLDRLHTKGYISDPKGKAKSVVLSPEGLRRARELFEQHFAQKSPQTEGS